MRIDLRIVGALAPARRPEIDRRSRATATTTTSNDDANACASWLGDPSRNDITASSALPIRLREQRLGDAEAVSRGDRTARSRARRLPAPGRPRCCWRRRRRSDRATAQLLRRELAAARRRLRAAASWPRIEERGADVVVDLARRSSASALPIAQLGVGLGQPALAPAALEDRHVQRAGDVERRQRRCPASARWFRSRPSREPTDSAPRPRRSRRDSAARTRSTRRQVVRHASRRPLQRVPRA